MHEERPNSEPNTTPAERASDVDILVGRVLDGEADEQDRDRFEELAAGQPGLWKKLALRQQDMFALSEHVRGQIASAERIDLPLPWHQRPSFRATAAYSGWAAVLMLGFVWAALSLTRPPAGDVPIRFVGQEHLDEYKRQAFVTGELQPIVVDVESMPDGSVMIRYLRRIEEMLHLDPGVSVPVDENDRFTVDPATLRKRAPQPPTAPD